LIFGEIYYLLSRLGDAVDKGLHKAHDFVFDAFGDAFAFFEGWLFFKQSDDVILMRCILVIPTPEELKFPWSNLSDYNRLIISQNG
jgi:hypothetical protein